MKPISLCILAAILLSPSTLAQQAGTGANGTLTATVILVGGDLSLKPVPRKPFSVTAPNGTSSVGQAVTSFSGEIALTLPPGDYRLHNPQPVELEGRSYSWSIPFTIVSGRNTSLELSNDNATVSAGSPAASEGLVSESDLYRRYSGSVFKIIGEGGHGSGFLVDSQGLILTNHHVVSQAGYLAVNIDERSKYAAEVVLADDVNDIAVLRVHPLAVEGRAVLSLAPNDVDSPLVVGEKVMAIGSPLATEAILTSGIVSKVEADVIYSDISIDEGNSGGPLFDSRGEVIGVNTFGMRASGSGISGVVRIHVAARVLEDARRNLGSPPPSETRLPVPSGFAFPAAAVRQQAIESVYRPEDYHLEADDFDVTFVDPIVVASLQVEAERAAAETRAKRNRDNSGASEEEIGSGFYEWRRYAGDYRPVVTVQVTPELKAALGKAFIGVLALRFKADFGRMELIRGGVVIEPFHPGRIRQVIDDSTPVGGLTDVGYFGAYEYPPEAFEPGQQLVVRIWQEGQDLYTEHVVPPTLVAAIWSHFEPHLDAIRAATPTSQ